MTKASLDDVDLVLKTMATTIVDNAVYFAQLDSVVGDGDFGYSLRNGFDVVVADYDTLDRSAVGPLLKKIGIILSGKVGGVSGPIWGTAFLRAGAAAGDKTELGPEDVIAMLPGRHNRDHGSRRRVARREDTSRRARPGDRQPRSRHQRSDVPR
jgi:dihydroxyacetone kinase/dihydroxyacetone kinase-like protein